MSDRFDLKLFLLQFFRKIYIVLAGAVLFSLIIGGIYTFVKIVQREDRYRSSASFYEALEFNYAEVQYMYVNEYTWNDIIRMDWIVDRASENTGGKYTPRQIAECMSATVTSDVRIVTVYSTAETPEKSLEVLDAVVPVMLDIPPEVIHELGSMTLLDQSDEAVLYHEPTFSPSAFELGALLGALLAAFLLSVVLLVDDSSYIPMLFTAKYGVPAELGKEVPEGALAVGSGIPDMSKVSGGSISLYILSGKHNGKAVDYVLNDLKEKGKTVDRAYIVGTPDWLVKGYYAGTRFPNPFLKRDKV